MFKHTNIYFKVFKNTVTLMLKRLKLPILDNKKVCKKYSSHFWLTHLLISRLGLRVHVSYIWVCVAAQSLSIWASVRQNGHPDTTPLRPQTASRDPAHVLQHLVSYLNFWNRSRFTTNWVCGKIDTKFIPIIMNM